MSHWDACHLDVVLPDLCLLMSDCPSELSLQSHSLMLDARRPIQLPLMREATPLQNIHMFQDTTTNSSLSPPGGSSNGGLVVKTSLGDPNKDAQAHAAELSAKLAKIANSLSWGGDEVIRADLLQNGDLQKGGEKGDADEKRNDANGDEKKATELNDMKLDDCEEGLVLASNLKVDVRERIKTFSMLLDKESTALGLAARDVTAAKLSSPKRNLASTDGLKKDSIIKELKERGRKDSERSDELQPGERWQEDARRREELAQRVVMENNGSPSPLSQLLSNPRGSSRSALNLLGVVDDHQRDAGDDFFQSDEGQFSPLEREMTRTRPSISLMVDSNPKSPLKHKTPHKTPQSSGRKKQETTRSKDGINLRRPHTRKLVRSAVVGLKEATPPALAMDGDELGVSELPQQNGSGTLPWEWTPRIHKHRAKTFKDLAAMDTVLQNNNSRGVMFAEPGRDVNESTPPVQSSYSLDSDANAPTLIIEDTHDSDLAGFYIDSEVAREIPYQFGMRRGSSQNAVNKRLPADATILTHEVVEGHRNLSQKYRPRSFEELVGQTMVVKSLSTAVFKGKVAPVYLFMGPRGTGKTSAARIFAAGLNCLSPEPERRPCGMCRECGMMSLNRCPDVREIDAASNVDLAKMRTSMGSFVPHSRFKVFIVEGCDLLSTQIWNAFLKVLEEPPRNVVFILITTHADRIPLTAMSRCQKFHFCKMKEMDIVSRLQTLAGKEDVEVEEGALSLIASRSDGSLRDAEITLDQLCLLDKKVSMALVQELVGLLPNGKLLDLLDLALSGDTVNTVRTMREILNTGVEPLSLVSQLGALITDILVGVFEVHEETREKGFFNRRISKKEEQQRLRQALRILSEAEKQLRGSNDSSTWLTAALLQFAPDRSFYPSPINSIVPESPPASKHTKPVVDASNISRRRQSQVMGSVTGRTVETNIDNREQFDLPDVGTNPADVSEANFSTLSERKMEEAWSREPQQIDGLAPEFQAFGEQVSIELWNRVIRVVTSRNLKHLLQTQGRLVSAGVSSDGTSAIVEVEFQYARDKQKAERSWRSICSAFQAVLNTPVEVRITLIESPFDEAELVHSREIVMDDFTQQPAPSTQDYKEKRVTEESDYEIYPQDVLEAPLIHSKRRRGRSRKTRKATEARNPELLVQHDVEMDGVPRPPFRSRRGSRRRSTARPMVVRETSRSESSLLRSTDQFSGSLGEFSGSLDSGLLVDSKNTSAKDNQVLLSTMIEEPQSGVEDLRGTWINRSLKQKKTVQWRTDSGLAKSMEHKRPSMESISDPGNVANLCWKMQSPHGNISTQSNILGRRRAQGKALFLRLVPCAKSDSAITSNLTPVPLPPLEADNEV